jgi:predicted transcriptional regulator
MADDEKFLVVPLGKKSKAITQTVSNDTAMEIMELLADGPLATSKVAERLGIPLTTAQYNIEKLMEAGLVKVARTKYSEKGREVKLYEAMNRAIVILPGKSGTGAVMDALRRYIILLPVAIVCAAAVEYLVPLAPYWNSAPGISLDSGEKAFEQGVAGAAGPLTYSAASPVPSVVPTALPPVPSVLPVNAQPEAARSVMDQLSQSVAPYFHHAGLLFFAGCLLVLLLLVVLEYARYARTPKAKK